MRYDKNGIFSITVWFGGGMVWWWGVVWWEYDLVVGYGLVGVWFGGSMVWWGYELLVV